MYVKTKSGRQVKLPSPEEDARINAGIAADDDSPELDAAWFKAAKPAREFFPPDVYASLLAMQRGRGRPKAETTKVFTAIRLDADLIATFKATGKGWQTKVNAALRQYLDEHPLPQPD